MSGYTAHSKTLIKLKDEISFRDMIHTDLELVHVVEGNFRVIAEGIPYDLSAGDTFVLFPFISHAYERIGKNQTIIAIVNPDSYEQIASILTEYRPLSPLVSADALSPGFGELLLRTARLAVVNGHFNNNDPNNAAPHVLYINTPVEDGTIHNYLVAIISELLGAMSLVHRSNDDSDTIGRILQYCHAHYREPTLSVSTVADAVGISHGHLLRIFKDKIGIGFTELIHKQRIERARIKLQRTSMSMIEIAYECGFASVRSFNRVFLKEVGIPPSVYRKTPDRWKT